MKLGNIVSKDEIKVSSIFNLVKNIEDIDTSLPTLIVGFDYVDKHYPDFNILEFELKPNFYWTFKRTEKRDKFEEDLNLFTKKVYSNVIKDISYIYIDFILYKPKKLIKITRKILSEENLITIKYKGSVFIASNKLIFGIDLSTLNFVGFDVDKVLNKIKSKSSVFLDDDSIFIEYKNEIRLLDEKVFYLPYLYSIKHEQ